MLNIEMKDFLENEDTSDFSHTRMNIHFRELAGESPLLVKLIMQSIYKNNDRKCATWVAAFRHTVLNQGDLHI